MKSVQSPGSWKNIPRLTPYGVHSYEAPRLWLIAIDGTGGNTRRELHRIVRFLTLVGLDSSYFRSSIYPSGTVAVKCGKTSAKVLCRIMECVGREK